MKEALVFDCNYICHSIYHSLPPLAFHRKYTTIIYGFIKRIMSYSSLFPKTNNIIFVWDSMHSLREEIYPIYKLHRRRMRDEADDVEKNNRRIAKLQFTDIRKSVLPALGFENVFIQDGYEADDLMASVVNNNSDYNFTIITTDKDIYQLISENCKLYNPSTEVLRDVAYLEKEWGCSPTMWGEAKAIAGCSTDHVIGVKGVGEKTAIKYLLGNMSKKSKKYKDIKASGDMIIENRELVVLPMYGTMKISINGDNRLSTKRFADVCKEYGFKSFLNEKHFDRWSKILC